MMSRRRFHRALFVAAGIYNIAWGVYSVIDPQWLFRFAGMAPSNRPQIFQTLGMIVGLYGFVYLEIARRPERGWVLAAVGLAGKTLGPIGLLYLIISGTRPAATIVIAVTNDFVWWIPFSLYLHDAWPAFRRDLSETG